MRLEQRRHVERVAGQQRRHKTGQVHGRVDSPQVVIGKSWLTPQEVLRPKRFRRLTVEPLSNTVRSRGTDADFDQLNRSPGEVTRNASTFDIFWSLTGGTIRGMQRSGTTRLPRPRTQTCTERLNFRVRVLRGQVDLIAATKRQRRCRRRALAGTAGWRTRRHCRPKWSDGNTRGCALDIGSVPNKSMLAPDHLGPLRSTRSNRTCLRLFLLSNRMRLIDVSSVKPSSCGRSAGQRSQYGATIRPFSSSRMLKSPRMTALSTVLSARKILRSCQARHHAADFPLSRWTAQITSGLPLIVSSACRNPRARRVGSRVYVTRRIGNRDSISMP